MFLIDLLMSREQVELCKTYLAVIAIMSREQIELCKTYLAVIASQPCAFQSAFLLCCCRLGQSRHHLGVLHRGLAAR